MPITSPAPLARLALAAVAFAAVVGSAPPTRAGVVTQGSSGAYFASSSLTLTALGSTVASASLAPLGQASGTAPGAYSTQATLTSAGADVNLGALGLLTLLDLGAQGVTSTVASTVNGQAGSRTTTGQESITGLNLGILTNSLGLSVPVLSVTANAVTSNASASGDHGALSRSGSVDVTGLSIKLLGTTLFTAGPQTALAANLGIPISIPVVGGVSIVLNEQTSGGNGVTDTSMISSFLHVKFTNFGVAGVGTLNGDLYVGQASAQQAAIAGAVPEPSSLALAGVGLGLVLLGARRRLARRPAA